MRSTSFALVLLVFSAVGVHGDDKPDYNRNVKVTKLLRTSVNSIGQPIVYPKDVPAEISVLIVEIPPGQETGWHKHPVPIFAYVLQGTVTVHFADGTKKAVREGEAVAESVNVLHNGRNEGKTPVKLLIFVAGQKNTPFTVKAAVDKDGRPLGDFENKRKELDQ